MKKCVYYAIMGEYDNLKNPKFITPGWDYLCFTNNRELKSDIFEMIYIDDKLGDAKLSRKVKINFHKYVKNYDLSIYIDGNIQVVGNLDKFLKDTDIEDDEIDFVLAKHPYRKCIYKEAIACDIGKKDSPEVMQEQIAKYRKEGYPKKNGLVACSILIRKHGRSHLEKHCELWWNEVERHSVRDQLSFNYILWKYSLIKIKRFSYKIFNGAGGGYFKKYKHNKKV